MEQITRDGDIITIKSEVTRVIDLAPLKAELASLKAQTEPTDAEVLEWAKKGQVHPYYEDQERIIFLTSEIERYG